MPSKLRATLKNAQIQLERLRELNYRLQKIDPNTAPEDQREGINAKKTDFGQKVNALAVKLKEATAEAKKKNKLGGPLAKKDKLEGVATALKAVQEAVESYRRDQLLNTAMTRDLAANEVIDPPTQAELAIDADLASIENNYRNYDHLLDPLITAKNEILRRQHQLEIDFIANRLAPAGNDLEARNLAKYNEVKSALDTLLTTLEGKITEHKTKIDDLENALFVQDATDYTDLTTAINETKTAAETWGVATYVPQNNYPALQAVSKVRGEDADRIYFLIDTAIDQAVKAVYSAENRTETFQKLKDFAEMSEARLVLYVADLKKRQNDTRFGKKRFDEKINRATHYVDEIEKLRGALVELKNSQAEISTYQASSVSTYLPAQKGKAVAEITNYLTGSPNVAVGNITSNEKKLSADKASECIVQTQELMIDKTPVKTAILQTHDAIHQTFRSEFYLSQEAKEKFESAWLWRDGIVNSIPHKMIMKWAADAVERHFSNPNAKVPLTINMGTLPQVCVEAIMLYCRHTNREFLQPPIDLTITSGQLKRFDAMASQSKFIAGTALPAEQRVQEETARAKPFMTRS